MDKIANKNAKQYRQAVKASTQAADEFNDRNDLSIYFHYGGTTPEVPHYTDAAKGVPEEAAEMKTGFPATANTTPITQETHYLHLHNTRIQTKS